MINKVFSAEKLLLARMMESLGNPPVDLVLWDGQEISSLERPALARVLIRDRGALLKLIANPELEFRRNVCGGAHRGGGKSGGLSRSDLSRAAAYRAVPDRPEAAGAVQRSVAQHAAGARHNIHHHYDIGNDFYKLWLDRDMVYTCAYFPDPAMSLEDAQAAKLDYVCRKLRLSPGKR